MQITPSQIADQLASNVETVVHELLPNGKRQGHEWCAGSAAGEEGSSLKVHLTGDRAGMWKDFSSSEKGGDLLDLACATKGIGMADAIKWACEWLGIERPKMTSPARRQYVKPERPAEAAALVRAPKVSQWFAMRRISPETLTKFKIAAKGTDAAIFPFIRDGDLVHIQYRSVVEKKFWASADTELILFGWQALSTTARSVIICEGPMDALAWAEYGHGALSVPVGGGGGNKQSWISSEFDNLERFDKIYISMDNDDTGKQAQNEIVDRLGRHRCYVIDLPRKDVNQCLIEGIDKAEIDNAVKSARTLDPAELRNATYFTDAVVDHFHPKDTSDKGVQMPWDRLAGTLCLDYGATSILAGWNSCGKSTMIGHIITHAAALDVKCCIASLEFRSSRYFSWLTRQCTHKPIPEPDDIRRAMDWMGDYMWAFDSPGEAKIEKILEVFSYAHSRYGTRLFILDNFSKLSLAGTDENRAQKDAITKITEFALATNTHVLVAAHSRKKFNENEHVGKLDIKGSGALTDLVDTVMLLHRNKKKENALRDPSKMADLELAEQADIHEQPDAFITCEKNRHGEDEPHLHLWFDKQSHLYTEERNGMPPMYVRSR